MAGKLSSEVTYQSINRQDNVIQHSGTLLCISSSVPGRKDKGFGMERKAEKYISDHKGTGS